MNATVMAGASRGRGGRIIFYLRHGFTLLLLVLLGLGSGYASSKPLPNTPTLAIILGTRLSICVFGLVSVGHSSIYPTVCSAFCSGFTLLPPVLLRLGSGSASPKPLFATPTLGTILGTRLIVCVFGPFGVGHSFVYPVVYSTTCRGVLYCSVVMPLLRQRMLSRRGTSRGAPSRPSSGEATPASLLSSW